MEEEIISILRERKVPEVDIRYIMLDCEDLASLKKYLKIEKSTGKQLSTKIFNEQYKEPTLIKNIENKLKNKTLSYRIEYKVEANNDILNVTSSIPLIGDLKMLTGKLNFIMLDLDLMYGNLKELESDTRESLNKIDLYNLGEYHYNFCEVTKKLEKDLKRYNEIRIWSLHNRSNDFLVPYYFIYRYYDLIKDKKIKILFIDEIDNKNFLSEYIYGELEQLTDNSKYLTKEEILEYKEKWIQITNKNSFLRVVKNNKINYMSLEEAKNIIMNELKGNIKRTKFISKLQEKETINGCTPCIYSHIIDELIKGNKIKSENYNIPNFIPNDTISVIN